MYRVALAAVAAALVIAVPARGDNAATCPPPTRVRLDMLSARLRPLVHSVQYFRSKWRGRSWCRAEYAVDDCGSTSG